MHVVLYLFRMCFIYLYINAILSFEGGDMLVPVEYKGVSKWVRVPKVEEVFNYSEFLQGGN